MIDTFYHLRLCANGETLPPFLDGILDLRTRGTTVRDGSLAFGAADDSAARGGGMDQMGTGGDTLLPFSYGGGSAGAGVGVGRMGMVAGGGGNGTVDKPASYSRVPFTYGGGGADSTGIGASGSSKKRGREDDWEDIAPKGQVESGVSSKNSKKTRQDNGSSSSSSSSSGSNKARTGKRYDKSGRRSEKSRKQLFTIPSKKQKKKKKNKGKNDSKANGHSSNSTGNHSTLSDRRSSSYYMLGGSKNMDRNNQNFK
jgi:hypothetical protein